MNPIVKSIVRARFRMTSREKTSAKIQRDLDGYVVLLNELGEDLATESKRVPAMLGVDEDMREWSLLMILEHNAIVNESITGIMDRLANGEDPAPASFKDIKRDVMPSDNPCMEQLERFIASVENHLEVVDQLPSLKGTATHLHPIFGPLDAHGWHGMFELHLEIHLKQARKLAAMLV